MSTHNPPWTRDELILALDLYFRHDRKLLDKTNPEIIQTSKLLKQLLINNDKCNLPSFRSNNSVYMKLANFRSIDPKFSGDGLPHGGKMDKMVWDEFSSNPQQLRLRAQEIIDHIIV